MDSIYERPTIKIIGIGGAGCNAVSRMAQDGIEGAEFVAVNTSAYALSFSLVTTKLQLGVNLLRGMGTAGDVSLGQQSAEEAHDSLLNVLSSSDMVFLISGMGGGTGTGATPLIAELAKKSGAITVAVVTRPFSFEGTHRSAVAEQGIERLKKIVDSIVIISNDRLLNTCAPEATVEEAFRVAEDTLGSVIQRIIEAITTPEVIKLDFASIKSLFKSAGAVVVSAGIGVGQDRAKSAATASVNGPLVDTSLEQAKSVFWCISSDNSLSLREVGEAAQIIAKAVHPDADIIFTMHRAPKLQGAVEVVIVASRFERDGQKRVFDLSEQDYYKHIGQRLRQARLAAKRTQEECASVIGLGSSVGYANYESGKRHIPLPRLVILADYLNRDLAYLISVPPKGSNVFTKTGWIESDYSIPALSRCEFPINDMRWSRNGRRRGSAQRVEKIDEGVVTKNCDIIINQVAQYFGVRIKDVRSRMQNRRVSLARQIAMYLMRECFSMTFAQIGQYFAKDSSTVFNAHKRIASQSRLDKKLIQQLSLITGSLGTDRQLWGNPL